MFENSCLLTIFEAKRKEMARKLRNLHCAEVHGLQPSTNIVLGNQIHDD
jgi:hypothetical protein